MNKDCKPILTKKKCCKDIQVSKIESVEDINQVVFQENPCVGSLHIVQFENSFVIYKYYNKVWNKVIDLQ